MTFITKRFSQRRSPAQYPAQYATTTLPLQRLLLLRIRDQLLLHIQPLPPPHLIHIPPRHILLIRQLAQILQLVLCERDPKRIFVNQHLITSEDELRGGSAGGAFADVVAEAEGFGDGEDGDDGEEGGPFVHGLGDDAAAALVYYGVDFA